jgi:hypothetical protein
VAKLQSEALKMERDELEVRIYQMETTVARLKKVVAVLALALVCAILIAAEAPVPKEIVTRSLRLVDEKGDTVVGAGEAMGGGSIWVRSSVGGQDGTALLGTGLTVQSGPAHANLTPTGLGFETTKSSSLMLGVGFDGAFVHLSTGAVQGLDLAVVGNDPTLTLAYGEGYKTVIGHYTVHSPTGDNTPAYYFSTSAASAIMFDKSHTLIWSAGCAGCRLATTETPQLK